MASNEFFYPPPPLLSELAINDDFTNVLFRLYSIDHDFNFILQAIKTRRNIKILRQDGYFERAVSLAAPYTTMNTLDHFIFTEYGDC